jgi:hypothetical protein
MGLFGYDSVPELNPKNLGNSPRFLSVTHTTLTMKRYRIYGILKIYQKLLNSISEQNSG